MKVAEARDLQDELQRVKAENVDLQRHITDFASVEAAKKKAEGRVEQLEEKACPFGHVLNTR